LDNLGHGRGHADANDGHRTGIDQLAVALEPHAVAVGAEIRFRILALAQFTPDAREGLMDVGLVARRVFERGIEDRFHVTPLAVVLFRPLATLRRYECGNECHDHTLDAKRYGNVASMAPKISSATRRGVTPELTMTWWSEARAHHPSIDAQCGAIGGRGEGAAYVG